MEFLILAAVVATVSWTVTKEDVFKGAREYCRRRSDRCRGILEKKFFYLFTCEYCFSHWVALLVLLLTRYRLLYSGALGYVVAGFALMAAANVLMGAFSLLRQYTKLVAQQAKLAEYDARRAPR